VMRLVSSLASSPPDRDRRCGERGRGRRGGSWGGTPCNSGTTELVKMLQLQFGVKREWQARCTCYAECEAAMMQRITDRS